MTNLTLEVKFVGGPIIFQGYYKGDVHMKEVIDEDEWLHTGEIGLWLPCDRLKIIDSDVGREGFHEVELHHK
ncbi:long chain acyl-CoA synthetase 6, peroxisomal-like [Iris pallida]|uniref:Long chain acyl-CoA synthetase 6, peroxisomal-like n=1 Tax=Iris pallida TaxID=29817 RepID=A0AAX6G1Q8_IRIPA|nr:long chain acyl-CoA synthetase 6, peroxisomal-like [Iris pallida]